MSSSTLNITIEVDDKGSLKVKQFGQAAESAGKTAADGFTKTGRSLESMNSGINSVTGLMTGLIAVMTSYASLKIAQGFIDTAASFEAMEIKLQELTGHGKQTLEELTAWAMKMPVSTKQAVESFTLLQAMGIEPTIEKLQILTDVSSILGQDVMPRLSLVMGQMAANGKINAQDLNQFAQAGINVKQMLSDAFGGKTIEQIQESGVAMTEVISAIWAGLDKQFGGAALKMQDAWQGVISRMTDHWDIFKKTVMDSGPFDVLKTYIIAVINQIDEMKANGQLDVWAGKMAEGVVAAFKVMASGAKIFAEAISGIQLAFGSAAEIYYNVRVKTLSDALKTQETALDAYQKSNKLFFTMDEDAAKANIATTKAARDEAQINLNAAKSMISGTSQAIMDLDKMFLDVEKKASDLMALKNNTKNYFSSIAEVYAAGPTETKPMAPVIDEAMMKKAKKLADEYKAALESTVDQYNKLTMSADDYKRTAIWQEWENSKVKATDYALAVRDAALAVVNSTGEQAKAIAEASDEYNKLSLSASEYKALQLDLQYAKDTAAVNGNAAALEQLRIVYEANKRSAEELDIELGQKNAEGLVKSIEENAAASVKAYQDGVEEAKKSAQKIEKIYDHMWESIQDSFADSIEGMFDKGLDSWGDFFDNIEKAFKHMLAQLSAAWITSGIVGLFTNQGTNGFSVSLGGGTTSSGSGGGVAGTASSAITLASLVKSIYNLPETIAALPDKIVAGYETVAGWFADNTSIMTDWADTTIEGLMEAYGYGSEMTAQLAKESAQIIADASAELAAETGATIATETGGAAASSAAGSLAAYGAGALFAVMQFVASDTFRELYYGGTKTSYQVLREDEAAGYTKLDPEMRDWLKADLLNSAAVNFGLQSIVQDMDSFVESHKELLSMTMDKFDYLLQEQTAYYAAAVDTTGTNSNTLAGFTLNYNSADAVNMALQIADDVSLSLQEKMYQLGFVAASSGGWESTATLAMIARFVDAGVAWSDINNAMASYGVPQDTGVYGLGDLNPSGHAMGGRYDANSPFIVGEAGWELIDPRNQTVFSHQDSLRIASMTGMKVPGYAAGTTQLGYSASATPNITFNITNKTGSEISAKTTRVSRTDQGLLVDLIVDAAERNVGGIRKVFGIR